jgi:leader peptidase (prepilin peptidase)/N-methyltransferase
MLFVWVALAAGAGFLVGSWLASRGMSQLGHFEQLSRGTKTVSRVAVGAAGALAAIATERAGSWWLLPALLVWAYVLAGAAVCDACTKRVPTALVRQGGLATAALLVGGSAIARDWRGLATAALAAIASGLIVGFCWRFAGAGLGDVRLAVLGGLGLGHVDRMSLVVGVVAFTLITLTAAAVCLARGGSRHDAIPYGPALATGFLLAAAV